LEEEFVDSLEVRPGGVDLVLLLDSGLGHTKVGLLDVGQGSENVSLDHGHDFVQLWNNKGGDILLVAEHLLELVDRIESFSLQAG
jgi:hypothetical protein